MISWKRVDSPLEQVLLEVGSERLDLVVVDADLSRGTQTDAFREKFPERYFNMGIAEQNMTSVGAGLSLSGRPVIIGTFAVFQARRACDQMSISVAYSNTNVKMMGILPGLSSGFNGASHQSVEDLAIMRATPNMIVMAPVDAVEIGAAVRAAVEYKGPVYMRMRRNAVPVIFGNDYEFKWGKGVLIHKGTDVCLIGTGVMTEETLRAREILRENEVDAAVLHLHTLKPLDTDAVIRLAEETGAVVTAENHSIYGGLGSAVAEVLAENIPTPMKRIGILDKFGETGSNEYLFKKYKLTAQDVADAAIEVIARKQNG